MTFLGFGEGDCPLFAGVFPCFGEGVGLTFALARYARRFELATGLFLWERELGLRRLLGLLVVTL